MPKILRDRMNNREFDDIIKKKLESMNTDGSDDAWDLFKERWDNESSVDQGEEVPLNEDQILDAKIKKDMQDLRIPFNSKHWIILKEQLELEALFKKKLFVAKSVELVILAFLVVGILNLWPIQHDIHQIPFHDIPMVASIPVDKETAEKYEAREEARKADQLIANQKNYNSTRKLVQRAISAVDFLPSAQETSIKESTTKNNSPVQTNRSVENRLDHIFNNTSTSFPFINIPQQNDGLIGTKGTDVTATTEDGPIALLQSKELMELVIPKRPTGFPDITLLPKTPIKEENTYISFSIGPKMNLVNSPFDPVYEIDPYNTINTNFNISAKIQKEIGPIELFAGLGYANTSYAPRLVDEIYEPKEKQFNVASLENIKFETFNIPIGVKYNLVEKGQYQIYATAGVDMNIIADSEYIIQDVPIGERFQPASQPPPASSKNTPPVNSNAKLSQKDFNKGILSGGSLKDNLYAAASIGFGLNWNIANRSGIFIEPRYSHFISTKGIGPNEDKVHGLSIDLGFRYQLN